MQYIPPDADSNELDLINVIIPTSQVQGTELCLR